MRNVVSSANTLLLLLLEAQDVVLGSASRDLTDLAAGGAFGAKILG